MQEISASGGMIDISLPVSPGLPVWPGDPSVVVEPVSRITDGEVANVSSLACSSHTGTHVDAPWHFVESGPKLEEVPLERWVGPCVVVDIPRGAARIERHHLDAAPIPAGVERLLFRTSNSMLWKAGHEEFDERYVALSPDAARWVVDHDIRLVGIDYLSIEAYDDEDHETHRTLLSNGVAILEGLNLSDVRAGPYTLVCLPLRLTVGDGAPARAVLLPSTASRTANAAPRST